MSVRAEDFDRQLEHDTAEAYTKPALPVAWVWYASVGLWFVIGWVVTTWLR